MTLNDLERPKRNLVQKRWNIFPATPCTLLQESRVSCRSTAYVTLLITNLLINKLINRSTINDLLQRIASTCKCIGAQTIDKTRNRLYNICFYRQQFRRHAYDY